MTGGRSICVLVLALAACGERAPCPDEPPEVWTRSAIGVPDQLDLLFMIENAGDLSQEQAALVREIPELVRAVVTGDHDGDGIQESEPFASVHIGVVTSDMGTGGFAVPTCDVGTFGNELGDDGVLITRGSTWVPGCAPTYPGVLEFAAGATDPAAYASDVSCVARAGTAGCGFEQHLEAVLKAVSPSAPQAWTREGYEPPRFVGSTSGHADGANAGFLRAESVLAVVLLANEEDCSAAEPGIFDASSSEFPGDLNLRCWEHEDEALHPIERYVAGETGRGGLLGLRDDPRRLVFAVIAGVPPETVPADGSTPDYDAMLAHSDMQHVLDPDAPETAPRLRPSCNVPGVGEALPPRRIVRVAQGLAAAGARTTVQSACQEDYTRAFAPVIELLRPIDDGCFPVELEVDDAGLAGCELLEILPVDGEAICAELPGRRDAGTRTVLGEVRTVCEVTQISAADSAAGVPGWYYETAEQPGPGSDVAARCGPTGQRVVWSIEVPRTSDIELRCPPVPGGCP